HRRYPPCRTPPARRYGFRTPPGCHPPPAWSAYAGGPPPHAAVPGLQGHAARPTGRTGRDTPWGWVAGGSPERHAAVCGRAPPRYASPAVVPTPRAWYT